MRIRRRHPSIGTRLLAVVLWYSALFAGADSLRAADAAAPLRLVGTVDGQEFAQFTVEKGELMARDANGTRPIPREVRWRLEGDLQANVDRILLRPDYEILTRPVRSASLTIQARKYGVIRIDRAKRWKNHRGAVIVFAWIVDGKATWTDVRPAPNGPPSDDVAAITVLELDLETERGFPVALAFAGDNFLKLESSIRQEPLRQAVTDIYLGSTEDFERDLAALKSVNVPVNTVGSTLLHLAAERGNASAVRALCLRGAAIGDTGRDQRTALAFAAANGRLDTVRTIVAAAAESGRKSRHSGALTWAIFGGHVDVALELLDENQRNVRSGDLKELLSMALYLGDHAAVSKLLSRGAAEDWVKVLPKSRLQVLGYRDPALTRILLAGGLQADDVVDGIPHVHTAAKAGDAESVGLLLQGGAKVNRAARDGTTALMAAIASGDGATVEVLLNAGANAIAQDRSGISAMDYASMMRRQDLIALLQTRGVPLAEAVPDSGRRTQRRASGDESYSEHVGNPIYDAREVDLMPVAKVTPRPDIIHDISPALERLGSSVTANPITGVITERSGVVQSTGPVVAQTKDSDYWGVATLVVEPDGSVSSVQILRENPSDFGPALKKAIQRYEFVPGQRNGQPVRTRLTMAITPPQ